MEKDQTGIYVLGIILIVTVVGLVVGATNAPTGAAIIPIEGTQSTTRTLAQWELCKDHGNYIELQIIEKGKITQSLKKQDRCTDVDGVKHVSRVSCEQDRDGSFSYDFSIPAPCPQGQACMKDENGAGYCN